MPAGGNSSALTPLLLATALTLTGGCVADPVLPEPEPSAVSAVSSRAAGKVPRNTFVYDCDERGQSAAVITRVGPGEIAVWPPAQWGGGYYVLGQVRAASGSRYEGDDLVVWVKGDEAMFEVAGERHTGCQLNPHSSIWQHARLSGVNFRGVGNEPGWSIEIRDRRIDLEYDYGNQSLSIEADPPDLNPSAGSSRNADSAIATREYRGESEGTVISVAIEDLRCNDNMSGEPFEAVVLVRIGALELHGCGRWLSRPDPHP